MKALIIGGTGPTGPLVIKGLMDHGYDVTVYHRGYHEPTNLPKTQRHLHGDPYSKEALTKDFDHETFDLVVCTYGRLRYVADVFAGRTPKFVAAGGTPALMSAGHLPFPQGHEAPLREGHPTYTKLEHRDLNRRASAVAFTERQVMQHHYNADFQATIFRFASVYGAWCTRTWVGSVVKRIMDGRKYFIVPGDGSSLRQGVYADNSAAQVLLGCTRAEADGHIFECVDDYAFSLTDSIRIIAEALDRKVELINISHPLAYRLARAYGGGGGDYGSRLLSTYKQHVLLGYKDVVTVEEGLRRTARWMFQNPQLVDWDQMVAGSGDPLAYDAEDKLVAMQRNWETEVARAIAEPKAPPPPEGEWREVFDPIEKGGKIVDGQWDPKKAAERAATTGARAGRGAS